MPPSFQPTIPVAPALPALPAPAVMAAPAPQAPPQSELPTGWESLVDDYGEVYYFHEESGETSWDLPLSAPVVMPAAASVLSSPAPALIRAIAPPASAEEWEVFLDDSGEKYYVNNVTGETSWDPPVLLSAQITLDPPVPADGTLLTPMAPAVDAAQASLALAAAEQAEQQRLQVVADLEAARLKDEEDANAAAIAAAAARVQADQAAAAAAAVESARVQAVQAAAAVEAETTRLKAEQLEKLQQQLLQQQAAEAEAEAEAAAAAAAAAAETARAQAQAQAAADAERLLLEQLARDAERVQAEAAAAEALTSQQADEQAAVERCLAEAKVAALQSPAATALPPNWQAARSADGDEYFFHVVTGETTWDRPVLEVHFSSSTSSIFLCCAWCCWPIFDC